MAIIDNELVFDSDTIVSETFNSTNVIDLGKNGSIYEPLDIQVNLTKACSAGKITSIKVQSSVDKTFTTAIDEASFSVPSSLVQTSPCVLAQFKCPISFKNRYVRLVYTGATGTTGGKVYAYMTNGLAVAY
ncbi:MAG: hypothetical protein RR910_08405 [Acidaminococcaceae bacterium]